MIRRIFCIIIMCVCVVGICRAVETGEESLNGTDVCQVDSHSCAKNPNTGMDIYSCYGMTYSVSGVMSGTAGCLDREDMHDFIGDIGYSVESGSANWYNTYAGYSRVCLCEDSGCNKVVRVFPCGNGQNDDCATGYHWVSGTGCVRNSGCQNCSSSNWAVNGISTETMSEATCNSSTNYSCNKTTKYRCGANYYSAKGKSSATSIDDLGCTACPSGYTSPAGSTSVSACVTNSSGSQTCTPKSTCGSWSNKGSYEVRTCNRVLANCNQDKVYEYHCAAGYYAANSQTGGVASSANNLKCTRCPKIDNVQSKSSAGGVGKGVCCINPGDTGEDESGPFVIESTCCAS